MEQKQQKQACVDLTDINLVAYLLLKNVKLHKYAKKDDRLYVFQFVESNELKIHVADYYTNSDNALVHPKAYAINLKYVRDLMHKK